MIELHNCDCMSYMKTLEDNAFDLAIVDPPYGINGSLEMGLGDKRTGKKVTSKWKYKGWDNRPPSSEYFIELKRVSKNQVIWGGNYFNLPPSRCFLIWDKVQRIDQADCEQAWTSFNKSARIFQYARGNLQGFMNPNRFHPTEKPVALYKWILKNCAKKGDRILDTHGGSFSSAIACHDLNFDITICEIDNDYFNDGKDRLIQHQRQQRLEI